MDRWIAINKLYITGQGFRVRSPGEERLYTCDKTSSLAGPVHQELEGVTFLLCMQIGRIQGFRFYRILYRDGN